MRLLPILAATLLAACGPSASGNPPPSSGFVVYDDMSYRGKPDTAKAGLTASNILYESTIWPRGTPEGPLPQREAFAALVRAHDANPGPFVLDIERLPLKGAPDVSEQHLQTLVTLADWAKAAAPGKPLGYYGSGTLTRVPAQNLAEARALAGHVDILFPPMYTFDDDRDAWAKRAETEAAEARSLAPGKPVYFYLWPQYHDGTAKQFQYVDADYWAFQLKTARRYADGIVLWGPDRFDWDTKSGWWQATEAFMKSLR
jgi:hypothetical protein